MIPRRELGTTGIAVSALGLGTVKLGRNQGVKYPDAFALPSDGEVVGLLSLAQDLGINLLDTAPAYGSSEIRLGELLQGPLKHQRHHWLLCTKVGEEFVDGQSRFDFSAEHTRFSVERSLRRLHREVLDIVLVHSNGADEDIIRHQGTLDALADLKQAGKIRAFGMSTKTVQGGLLAAQQCDLVMVTWNLRERDQEAVIDYCARHRKGVLIKKILASGHLTNTASPADTAAIEQTFQQLFARAGVTSAIVGTLNPEHLRHNVEALNHGFSAHRL